MTLGELEAEVGRLALQNEALLGKLRAIRQELDSFDGEVISDAARECLLGTLDDPACDESREAEKLRAEKREMLNSWGETMEELGAYHVAVADVRALCEVRPGEVYGGIGCLDVLEILDRLPRDDA